MKTRSIWFATRCPANDPCYSVVYARKKTGQFLFLIREEILGGLSVQLRKLKQFYDIDAAVASLTFGEERMRHAQRGGDLTLGQSRLLAGLN